MANAAQQGRNGTHATASTARQGRKGSHVTLERDAAEHKTAQLSLCKMLLRWWERRPRITAWQRQSCRQPKTQLSGARLVGHEHQVWQVQLSKAGKERTSPSSATPPCTKSRGSVSTMRCCAGVSDDQEPQLPGARLAE